MRAFLLHHPVLSMLAYAWIIGAGAMFLPLVDASYRNWCEDRPKRERMRCFYRRPARGWQGRR
jgi:hypothetical protein